MIAVPAACVAGRRIRNWRSIVSKTLSGVIAAIATPVAEDGSPDLPRAIKLARHLLDNGCDGLNVLGTTGEATSFSREERMAVMSAYRAEGLPMDRLMVGTGAAAVSDAIALTRHAAELGFAGALLLPPFYYKGVPDDGLFAYISEIVKATEARPIPLYLYHFPAMSGLPWQSASSNGCWIRFRPGSWD
jgi:4-hydroxy-tetrahydrodipicolinate synthase